MTTAQERLEQFDKLTDAEISEKAKLAAFFICIGGDEEIAKLAADPFRFWAENWDSLDPMFKRWITTAVRAPLDDFVRGVWKFNSERMIVHICERSKKMAEKYMGIDAKGKA